MMNHALLLDVAPDPVGVGISAGLVMLAIVVLMCTAAFVVGFVFLFERLRRNDSGGSKPLVVGDVCLNLDNVASKANPQNSPNQS